MSAAQSHTPIFASGSGDWMLDRLTDTRGMLADVPLHPESLVILAARIDAGQTPDRNHV